MKLIRRSGLLLLQARDQHAQQADLPLGFDARLALLVGLPHQGGDTLFLACHLHLAAARGGFALHYRPVARWLTAMASRAKPWQLRALRHAETRLQAALVNSQRARQRARDVMPIIEAIRATGTITPPTIAAALNARDIPTPSGRGRWHAATVRRMIAFVGEGRT
jgi:hypothetical protein